MTAALIAAGLSAWGCIAWLLNREIRRAVRRRKRYETIIGINRKDGTIVRLTDLDDHNIENLDDVITMYGPEATEPHTG